MTDTEQPSLFACAHEWRIRSRSSCNVRREDTYTYWCLRCGADRERRVAWDSETPWEEQAAP